ncbi:MAG: ABC transporter [Epulopiscium sp. Nuni2H_MBin001]|nr:MAG: ABC transporter [Epulopiscium sp. Nuni2H_MBin001]
MDILQRIKQHQFLFEELVKRDFTKKYKRTILGVFWSILSPLLMLLVQALVFTQFFGRTTPHYIIYLFCGNLIYSYFKESTGAGMGALMENASIFSKINVPKYLFLLSKNVASFINFVIILGIFFIFVLFDRLPIGFHLLMLIYPIGCLVIFNLGMGLILSAWFMMFKDIKYLYDIFTMALMYFSAIFYTLDVYPPAVQQLFYLNPMYVYIYYFRSIVIYGKIPGLAIHFIAILYAVLAVLLGALIYKKKNYTFLYYI